MSQFLDSEAEESEVSRTEIIWILVSYNIFVYYVFQFRD